MKKLNWIAFFALLSLVLIGCKGNSTENKSDESPQESLIEITKEQFEASEMALGKLVSETFHDDVFCKGIVFAPANSIANLSTPIAGTIESIRFKIGDFVSRGQVLCTISGSEFLGLQQQFAESTANFQKAKTDFERIKALRSENIGAEKDLTASESFFKATQANYNALKTRINALHLSTSNIENGQMYKSFPLVSPISGHITQNKAVIGQYADLQTELAEIVNTKELQLQLSVFESDIHKLKAGQSVRFGLTGRNVKNMNATLLNVGKTIDPETKAITCIARINNTGETNLINQSMVEADIFVSDKNSLALPADAVQKQENNFYAYVLEKQENEKFFVKKTLIEIGKTNNNYTEILNGIPADKDVIIRGISTLH